MKMVLLGFATFIIAGLTTEHLLDKWSQDDTQHGAAQMESADLFLGAMKDGVAIPEREQPANHNPGRPEKRMDCTASSLAAPIAQGSMTGTVTRVVDGDTLRVTVEGTSMPVRLWGIDAPEMNQALGGQAQSELASMAPVNSLVVIHPMSMDKYGRIVGTVGQGQEWAINFLMVARGWAYHYREFSARNNSCLAEAESIARHNQIGVWKDNQEGRTRPWDYRKQARKNEIDPI